MTESMAPAPPAPATLSARAVLRLPNYRRLWLGQLVSEAGDGLTNLALLLLVNSITGSTAAIAAMAICLAIPPLTIGLFAGAYVDRADRRRIMLASDLLRAIVVLLRPRRRRHGLTPFLFAFVHPASEFFSVWHVIPKVVHARASRRNPAACVTRSFGVVQVGPLE
jgi:MFS family permease